MPCSPSWSWDSVVSIATCCGLDSQVYEIFCSSEQPCDPLMFIGYLGSFLALKQLGCEITTQVLRLSMSGATSLLSVRAFVAWTGTALP